MNYSKVRVFVGKDFFLQNEEFYFSLLKNLSDPLLLVECHTYRILQANQAALEIYGYIEQSELTRRTFLDLFAEPALQKKSCQKSCIIMENVTFIRHNGEIFHADVYGFLLPVPDSSAPLYLVLIKNSAGSEENYHTAIWQSVLHNIPLVLWIKDIRGRFLDVNEHFLKLHGYRKEDVIGRTDFDIFPESYAQLSEQEDRCVLYSRAKIHKEESFIRNDTEFWFETYKMPIINSRDQIIGIAGFSLNINERKEFDKQLKSKQEWLETTLRSIAEAVITIDNKGYVTSLNPIAETYLGVNSSQVIGRSLHEVVFIRNPVDNQIENPFALVEQKGSVSLYQRDRTLLSKQGIEIAIEYKISPILDHDGFLTNNGFVLIITNITHHKAREQHLMAENQLMREFLDASPSAIFFTDRDGKIIRMNEEFSQLSLFSQKEIIGKHFWELFSKDDQLYLKKEFEALVQHIKLKNHVFTLLDKNDVSHQVELSANLVHTLREDVCLFILNDISDKMNQMRLVFKQQTSLQLVEEILSLAMESHNNLPMMCQKIAAFMDIQRFFVYRWIAHEQKLDPLYLWSHGESMTESLSLESRNFSQDWIGRLLQQRYLILSANTPLNMYEKKLFEKTGLGSVLFLPLWFQGQFWGALGVYDLLNPQREWDETQLAFFRAIAPLFITMTSFRSK